VAGGSIAAGTAAVAGSKRRRSTESV